MTCRVVLPCLMLAPISASTTGMESGARRSKALMRVYLSDVRGERVVLATELLRVTRRKPHQPDAPPTARFATPSAHSRLS